MLKQLQKSLPENLYHLALSILAEQVMFLALTNKITWDRTNQNELRGKVLIGLPGQKPTKTKVTFHRKPGDDNFYFYYLSLESEEVTCRNSNDRNIRLLAKQLFDKETKKAA